MKKVAFYTLGCKLNYSETSSISRSFEKRGYEKVDFTQAADIYIINTCSVTEHADRKCRKVVNEARRINPQAFVAIIGCYAQLKPQEIMEIPGVDAVLGAAEKFQLIDLLDGFEKTATPRIFHSPIEQVNGFTSSYSIYDRTRTFLKIQDGCNYSCSFCTIPLARGSSRSDTLANITKQAEEIVRAGTKEIVLTGVNTGDVGLINGAREYHLIDVMHRLEKIDALRRIRISSIEPNLLTDEMISFVSASKKFLPHFHLPLQSGSDKTLKAMRRRYLRDVYQSRVERIKDAMPSAAIGADVIVGFPGETKEDFLDTYRFINDLDISYLHVFTYSERPDTPAVHLAGKVKGGERAERSEMLHILSDKKRRKFYEDHLGQVRPVLFEQDIEDGIMHGFTDNYIRVRAPYDPLQINEIVDVHLHDIHPSGKVEVGDHAWAAYSNT